MEQQAEYRVYRARWAMLAMFCTCSLVNAMLWITYAPIIDLAAEFYGVSAKLVNLMAVSWNVVYLPGTFLASWVTATRGNRKTVLLGSGLTAVGAAIRVLGSFTVRWIGSRGMLGFVITLAGQTLAGIGQPMFLNGSALLAATWFGVQERNVATAVISFCNPLGSAVGQILPPIFVHSAADADQSSGGVHGLAMLSGVQASATVVAFLLVLLLFRDAPPTPPSRSTELRCREHAPRVSAQDVALQVAALLRNRSFQMLLASFGVGLCTFNSLMTLVAKYVAVQGYSDSDAGIFAGILLICGLFGAVLAGVAMECTHAYRPIYQIAFAGAGASAVFLVTALRPDQFLKSAIAFGLLGAAMLSLLPVTLENAVEVTYPASEELSAGILFSVGNLLSIGGVFGMEALIDMHHEWDNTVFTPVNILLLSLVGVAVVAAMLYHGPYLRYETERRKATDREISQDDVEPSIQASETLEADALARKPPRLSTCMSPTYTRVYGGKAGSVDDSLSVALLPSPTAALSPRDRRAWSGGSKR